MRGCSCKMHEIMYESSFTPWACLCLIKFRFVFMSVVNVSVFAYVSSFTHLHVCARLHTPWKICNRLWQMHVYLCMCPASHIFVYVLDVTHLGKYVIGYGRCMFAYVMYPAIRVHFFMCVLDLHVNIINVKYVIMVV